MASRAAAVSMISGRGEMDKRSLLFNHGQRAEKMTKRKNVLEQQACEYLKEKVEYDRKLTVYNIGRAEEPVREKLRTLRKIQRVNMRKRKEKVEEMMQEGLASRRDSFVSLIQRMKLKETNSRSSSRQSVQHFHGNTNTVLPSISETDQSKPDFEKMSTIKTEVEIKRKTPTSNLKEKEKDRVNDKQKTIETEKDSGQVEKNKPLPPLALTKSKKTNQKQLNDAKRLPTLHEDAPVEKPKTASLATSSAKLKRLPPIDDATSGRRSRGAETDDNDDDDPESEQAKIKRGQMMRRQSLKLLAIEQKTLQKKVSDFVHGKPPKPKSTKPERLKLRKKSKAYYSLPSLTKKRQRKSTALFQWLGFESAEEMRQIQLAKNVKRERSYYRRAMENAIQSIDTIFHGFLPREPTPIVEEEAEPEPQRPRHGFVY